MEQNREPRNKCAHIEPNDLRVPELQNRERIVSLTNCARKTGYPHAKE